MADARASITGNSSTEHGQRRVNENARTNVRIPLDHLLGGRGDGFLVAQTRLSGGRIHYGMRTIGFCKRALDMMCERAKSRTTQGSLLANKQMVQERVADAWCDLEKFKLLVLRTAKHPRSNTSSHVNNRHPSLSDHDRRRSLNSCYTASSVPQAPPSMMVRTALVPT